MQPELPVAIGRDLDARDDDAFHARLVDLDDQRRATRGDAQQLDRERWHDPPSDRQDRRHATNDAVPLGLHGEQTPARCCCLELRQISEKAGILNELSARVAADGRDRRFRKPRPLSRRARHLALPGLAENDAGSADRSDELSVAVGKRIEHGPGARVFDFERIGNAVRREAVWFRKDRVEADRGRASVGETIDEPCNDRARPRPLTQRLQRPVVDIDDRHRIVCGDARVRNLVEVEDLAAENLERGRIPEPQRNEGGDCDQACKPPDGESSC